MSNKFQLIKKQIEKMAQDRPHFSFEEKDTNKAPSKNILPSQKNPQTTSTSSTSSDIKTMQSAIVDFKEKIPQLFSNLPSIGTKSGQPDGGWGLKTNNALKYIVQQMSEILPLMHELNKEGYHNSSDQYSQEQMNDLASGIPASPKNNIVAATPEEKAHLAPIITQHLKVLLAIAAQYQAMAGKGEFRGLINDSQVLDHHSSLRETPDAEGTNAVVNTLNRATKFTDEELANKYRGVNISFKAPEGSALNQIPFIALLDKDKYYEFTRSLNMSDEKAKELFSSAIKPSLGGSGNDFLT